VTGTTTQGRRLERGDRVLVIANPATRADIAEVYRALSRALPSGIHLEIHQTEKSEGAQRLARRLRDRADCMIAVGGDGTVSSVAAALHGSDVLLGIIPGGSTNIIAREIGIPDNINAAIRLIFGKFVIRNMDVGVCNDRFFLHMAGAGFDSRLFDMTDPALKKKIGWVAYLPAAVKAIREPASAFRLMIDDDVIEVQSPLVLVANGSSVISPRIRVGSRIRPDDGELDILVVTATKPHELASVLARFASSSMDESPYVLYRRAKRMTMEADRTVPIQLDGDVIANTPARFRVLPQDIGVIVPTDAVRQGQ
jgi:diacylglycerol kinase (ATP)